MSTFSNAPLSPAAYLPSEGADLTSLVKQLTEQAFDLIASTDSWPKGKLFLAKNNVADGGPVQSRSKSNKGIMQGRLAKCAWHLRESTHPVDGLFLNFDDFRSGLLLDHLANEAEYIPGIVRSDTIEVLQQDVASVVLARYKLPVVTADRDFSELLITVDLPPHAAPFSPAHKVLIQQTELGVNPSPPTHANEAGGLRSFLVIQVPVIHPKTPEEKNYVRGAYASVEAVYEGSGPTGSQTIWKMATQSDARGTIPLFLSESTLPSKIVEDVPEFIHWARARKQKASVPPPADPADAAAAAAPTTAAGSGTEAEEPGAQE